MPSSSLLNPNPSTAHNDDQDGPFVQRRVRTPATYPFLNEYYDERTPNCVKRRYTQIGTKHLQGVLDAWHLQMEDKVNKLIDENDILRLKLYNAELKALEARQDADKATAAPSRVRGTLADRWEEVDGTKKDVTEASNDGEDSQ